VIRALVLTIELVLWMTVGLVAAAFLFE